MAVFDRRRFLTGASGVAIAGCVPDGQRSVLPDKDAGTRAPRDAGLAIRDAGPKDPDAGFADPDAGFVDAGHRDAGPRDGGPRDGGLVCDDPFEGGTMVGLVPFADVDRSFGVKRGQGWDARLYTDLSQVTPENPLIDNDDFFIRTEYPDLLNPPSTWRIAVDGLVNTTADIELPALMPDVRPQGAHVLECSGNFRSAGFGLLSAGEWSGVPLMDVIGQLDVSAQATRVRVSGFDMHSVPSSGGHSTPGAAWVFSYDQLARTGAFLATHMNGVPLPNDHGAPVRLYVPRWYGCSNIKWVDRITFVDDSAPSTSQMREFASRTHQSGVPSLARNYADPDMQQAAMPTRIERWDVGGQTRYRVVGILWGGYSPVDSLEIRFGSGSWRSVDVCPPMTQNANWTIWSYPWEPNTSGLYSIRMRIADSSIPTRRLDSDFYVRQVRV